MTSTALVIVDVQNDFLEGGVLGAPNSRSIIPTINQYIEIFASKNLPIYATRDWHPPNHISFISRGGRWPPHCVQDTPGAAFPRELKLPPRARIISKALHPDIEAYSGFQGTDLKTSLESQGVHTLCVAGIATEYCVKSTVLDALRYGFSTVLLTDAIAPIEKAAGDLAISEVKFNGCKISSLNDIWAYI